MQCSIKKYSNKQKFHFKCTFFKMQKMSFPLAFAKFCPNEGQQVLVFSCFSIYFTFSVLCMVVNHKINTRLNRPLSQSPQITN